MHFGTVSEEGKALIMRELLHANFLVRKPSAPAFVQDPVTGEIFLDYAYELEGASGAGLWMSMHPIIDAILKCRFLSKVHLASSQRSNATVAAPASAAAKSLRASFMTMPTTASAAVSGSLPAASAGVTIPIITPSGMAFSAASMRGVMVM
jgi:hypothetical protein